MVLGSPTSKDPVFSSRETKSDYLQFIKIVFTNNNIPVDVGPRASKLLLVLGELALTGSKRLGFKCAFTLCRSSLSSWILWIK